MPYFSLYYLFFYFCFTIVFAPKKIKIKMMTNFTKFSPTYANQGDKDEKELQDPISATSTTKKVTMSST